MVESTVRQHIGACFSSLEQRVLGVLFEASQRLASNGSAEAQDKPLLQVVLCYRTRLFAQHSSVESGGSNAGQIFTTECMWTSKRKGCTVALVIRRVRMRSGYLCQYLMPLRCVNCSSNSMACFPSPSEGIMGVSCRCIRAAARWY